MIRSIEPVWRPAGREEGGAVARSRPNGAHLPGSLHLPNLSMVLGKSLTGPVIGGGRKAGRKRRVSSAYARAILQGKPGVSPEMVEVSLTARMERQQLLHKEEAPMVWVVLDEAVLVRPIGSQSVMVGQLDHLLDVSLHPCITIQVLPFDAFCTTGVLGGFFIAQTRGMPDMAYLESSPHGRVVDRPDDVKAVATWYDAMPAPQRRRNIYGQQSHWTATCSLPNFHQFC